MANRRVEEQLDSLSRLRDAPVGEAEPALRKALGDRVGMVAGRAAKVAAEMQLAVLIPDLLRAFERLFDNPRERDPQCWGKNAIARALAELGHTESAPYLRGAHHIQMEPVYGGQEDTASALRGICLLALAACGDVRRETILRALVDGLADEKSTVRQEAVRAMVHMQGDESVLLLRLKARMGDSELPVVGQVFDGILSLEGQTAVEFVAGFLDPRQGDAAAEAALALGASRLPGSLDVLERAWNAARDPDLRATILRAVSASREKRAIEFLTGIVRRGRAADVAASLEALSIHQGTEEIRQLVEQAVRDGGPELEQQFRKIFRSSTARRG